MAKRKYLNRKGAAEKFCCGCEEKLVAGPRGNWHRSYAQRRQYRCKRCVRALVTAHRRRDVSRDAVVRGLLRQAEYRSVHRGCAFSVTAEDLRPFPTRCPLLNVPLRYQPSVGSGWQADSVSLDRIDNSLGYVPGNVWIVSRRANLLKRDATLAEMRQIVAAWALQRVFS